MKTRQTVFTNTGAGWVFGAATASSPTGEGSHELRIEVDGRGRFFHVFDDGQTFEADAADVAQLAADLMPAAVLEAVLAYGPSLGKSARDVTTDDVVRLNDYADRCERRLALAS